MISYLVDVTQQVLPIVLNHCTVEHHTPPLPQFVETVVRNSSVSLPILIASAVYLRRLQSYCAREKKAIAIPSGAHGVFLVALVVAAKFWDDAAPFNYEWVEYSFMPDYKEFEFSLRQLVSMERELLSHLNWNLNITVEEFTSHLLEARLRKDEGRNSNKEPGTVY